MTTTDIAIRDIQNITYTVSYHDMVQVWVDNYHSGDTVVIIYDPIKHIEYIKDLGISIPEEEVFESKILAVLVPDLDDAIEVVRNISHEVGPFAQAWALGRCITDNIDDSPRED